MRHASSAAAVHQRNSFSHKIFPARERNHPYEEAISDAAPNGQKNEKQFRWTKNDSPEQTDKKPAARVSAFGIAGILSAAFGLVLSVLSLVLVFHLGLIINIFSGIFSFVGIILGIVGGVTNSRRGGRMGAENIAAIVVGIVALVWIALVITYYIIWYFILMAATIKRGGGGNAAAGGKID